MHGAAEKSSEVAHNVWDGTKNTASSISDGTKNVASNICEGTKHAASDVADGTKKFVHSGAEKSEQAWKGSIYRIQIWKQKMLKIFLKKS